MAITSIEGERLVGSHCAGDPDAFPTIVKAHYPALLARARHRLHDPQLAEDAVQEALLRAYRSLPRFGGFGEFHLTAWLYRILENVCIDEANRRRRSLAVVERLASLPEEIAPDAETAANLPNPQVTEAIQGLPAPYRNALIQREVEGLSYADMAAVSGISEDNARARVSRARSALRRLIAPVVTAIAWIAGTTRRGERVVLLDGASTAAASSPVASAAVVPVSVHIPAATQLISQVTAVVPESQMVSAIKVATAAVIAVALPVGGVTAVQRNTPPPAPPAIEVSQSPEEPSSDTAVDESEAAGPEESGSTDESADIADELATDVAVPVTDEPTPEAGDEAVADAEPPVTEPAAPDAGPPVEEPAPAGEGSGVAEPSSAVVVDGSSVERLALEDGRYELRGPVSFTTSAGELAGRLSLLCALPAAGDSDTEEYRLAGSIVTDGEQAARVRLAGTMEAWSVDDEGVTTYIFSGRYSTNDSDSLGIAPRGSFTASFTDSWKPGLTVRLVPEG